MYLKLPVYVMIVISLNNYQKNPAKSHFPKIFEIQGTQKIIKI